MLNGQWDIMFQLRGHRKIQSNGNAPDRGRAGHPLPSILLVVSLLNLLCGEVTSHVWNQMRNGNDKHWFAYLQPENSAYRCIWESWSCSEEFIGFTSIFKKLFSSRSSRLTRQLFNHSNTTSLLVRPCMQLWLEWKEDQSNWRVSRVSKICVSWRYA